MKNRIEVELERLVKEGVYEPVSYAKWAAPIVPIPKDDGTVRICGDYKVTVNQAADVDNYPLPKTEDLFATLNGGKLFCKLDLSHAYQQLVLDDESRECLTVNTHKGLYQPTRLQYGVHSASGIFQREIEKRLCHIPRLTVRVDDILLAGIDRADLLKILRQTLDVIASCGLRLKKEKCSFMATEIVYLGFLINSEGVSPVKSKLNAILKLPAPTNMTQLKSFLGMLNYYHRHLPNLANVLEPLHLLLRKGASWNWGSKQDQSFNQAKQSLCSTGLLVHYDPQKPLVLSCDASPYGLGAVLDHILPDGSKKPIAYASRTLSTAERNYSQIEKEGLAVVFGVRKFHQYLYGCKFTIFTDHKPLLGLIGADKPLPSMAAARIQRWAVLLSGYNYELKYRCGDANGNADCMSRLPLDDDEPVSAEITILLNDLVRAPVTAQEVQLHSRRDPIISRVIDFVMNGWPQDHVHLDLPFAAYRVRQNELSVTDGCLLWGSRVVVPPTLRDDVLQELHVAHPGICRMKALARSYVWWPDMDSTIEEVVKSCRNCQENRNMPAKAPVHHWETVRQPWTRVHVDFAGPFIGKIFLMVIDSYSKWIEAFPLNTNNYGSKPTIECLRSMFATHGLPQILVSDNGTSFASVEFAKFLKANGIRHIRSAPYHPSTNGMAERGVQTFKDAMKKMDNVTSTETLQTRLNRFLFAYRTTPQTSTGLTPGEMLMNRKLTTALCLIKPDIHKKIALQQKECTNSVRNFETGDQVWMRNYSFQGKKWIAGIVEQKTGPLSYVVKSGRNIHRRHIDQMRSKSTETPAKTIIDDVEHNEIAIPSEVNADAEPDEMEHTIANQPDIDQPVRVENEERSDELVRSTRTRKRPSYLKDYDH